MPSTTPATTWAAAKPVQTPIYNQSELMQGVQARVVQHQYVRAQIRTINMTAKNLLQETMDQLRKTTQGADAKDKHLVEGFWHMTKRLQQAPLTINFKAASWFTTPNTYESYTQMYERGVRTVHTADGPKQIMRMTPNSANNNVQQRVNVDRDVTFTPQKQFAAKFGGLQRVMLTGNMVAPTVGAVPGEFEAANPYFNPKTKQVFAALNYGRRPHGANVYYGYSHMVINERFKRNALYFAGDTFDIVDPNKKLSASHQVSYDFLGAIYGKATNNVWLLRDIYKSCIHDMSLPDTKNPEALLEGHLFEQLTFGGNIAELVISPRDTPGIAKPEWHNILSNARAFAVKHGARLVLTD